MKDKSKAAGSFFAFVGSLFFHLSSAQTDVSFHKVEENMMNQLNVYPQEKVHLHTDRDFYVPGEKIWFKAYVVDASSHQHSTYSKYAYAELISPVDSLVGRVMIRSVDGMFYGYLPVPKNVPEGNYTLRAYTRHLENLGDDYFFKKNMRIGNLSSGKNQQTQTPQKNRKAKVEQDDYDVSFFPEGGNLPEGVFCRVAFKAINRNGYPETVSGKLMDENDNEIASIATAYAGMGVFVYRPGQGKRFYLKCTNKDGLEKRFELPQPSPHAYSLTSIRVNRKFLIGVQRAVHAPDMPCYLLAHCRGMVLYFAEWDQKEEVVSFTEEQLPSGVIQFVLFDGQMNPLSERLVFNKNIVPVKVDFHTDKAWYQNREKVISTLALAGSGGNPLTGHFSVAVTDDHDVAVDSANTILSSLLLSSELRGYIENPAYYLRDHTALDYLMMTHGWRRYHIPEVVGGRLEHPQIPFQTAQEISGKVKGLLSSSPVTDSELTILTKNGDFGMTSTDENGSFACRELEFPDSITFLIQALSRKGSSRVELVLDRESFPGLVYAPQSPIPEIPVMMKAEAKNVPASGDDTPDLIVFGEPSQGLQKGVGAFMEKAELRAMYDDDMRVIHIPEVEITAPGIVKKDDEPRLQYWVNTSSDVTITRDEFKKARYGSISGYINEALPAGFIRFSGLGYEPFILIDGMPLISSDPERQATISDIDDLMSVADVESIDIFKGASAALFGSRGDGGAISITTRRGKAGPEKKEFNHVVYMPAGYQKPAEFYSSKYDRLEAKQSSTPDYRTTIFWKPDVVISDEKEAVFQFYTRANAFKF